MNNKTSKKHEIFYLSLLLTAAFIWGSAFVAQSIGAEHVGPFTYLALRSWMGAAFLIPVIRVMEKAGGSREGKRVDYREVFRAGLVCGVILFMASASQQIGIAYTTTAKSSFITALYVVLVPIISLVLGKKPRGKVWFCMVLSVAGLYLLCLSGSGGGFSLGDSWTLACAFLFAMQIIAVDYFVVRVNAIRLSQMQFLITAVIASVCMIFERPALQDIRIALPSIMYAGIMSSGVAFTLQVIAQKKIEPSKAAIAMCMESVFGALCGWIIQGQVLSARELTGCAIMFASIVLSQVSIPVSFKRAQENQNLSI